MWRMAITGLVATGLIAATPAPTTVETPKRPRPAAGKIAYRDICGGGDDGAGTDIYWASEPFADDLWIVRETLGHPNQVTAFLVRGDTIAEAVRAARNATLDQYGAQYPVGEWARKGSPSQTLWAVVMFGSGGVEPPEWWVNSAEVRSDRLRVEYRTDTSYCYLSRTFLYFIKLGRLAEGSFFIELYESDDPEPVYSRKVLIPKQ